MNDQTKASMQIALEALESCDRFVDQTYSDLIGSNAEQLAARYLVLIPSIKKAIVTIRKQLVKPIVTNEERITHAYRCCFIDGHLDMRDREALAQPQGWQPIETAPRYGRVLVTGTDIGTCVASAGWSNDTPDDIRWEVVNDIVVTPTHWMPIPYWNQPQNHSGEATDMVQGSPKAWIYPTEDELKELHHLEQFGLFCDFGEFLDIATTVMAKFKSKNTPPVVPQGEPVAIPEWIDPKGCSYCCHELFSGIKCKVCGKDHSGGELEAHPEENASPVVPQCEPVAWIDPNDKTQAQYLPHIGEKVLFCHDGVTYYGNHTGGCFRTGLGITSNAFNTWECHWMYPPAAAKRSMK